ncbi:MAG: UDP-N-acetylglucosamine 2-epimerase (hydrolyzing) [Lachnospiraceae bacterium]|nr:UDP-N-acetylglucosamine 2-epimerase (hydrolyzing) [Lachnospiraceae bacterium]
MKVAVVTSTRAEYGLLHPLITELLKDSFYECQLLVTGTHLREDYGYTVKAIEEDGIPIAYRIPIMEQTPIEPEAVVACAIIRFGEVYRKEKYDAVILLGDRYELFGFAVPALFQLIPIVHIHGGECTEGAIDEQIRHAITKMASVHFPSVPDNAKRIIQMGENPQYVHAVGALGIDNVLKVPLMGIQELEKELKIDFGRAVALVTYHPVTLEGVESSIEQIRIVLEALLKTELYLLITMPNSDPGGNAVDQEIRNYYMRYPDRITYVASLGQRRYLSALKYAKIVVGNSSSGIIETASFLIPTIDIGNRQKGRFAPRNIIHCECRMEEIIQSIEYGLSEEFRDDLSEYENPYGDGHTAERIVSLMKEIPWKEKRMIYKSFQSIDFNYDSHIK